MATFKQQVEGITSLTIGTTPTNDELSQFLVDGTKEVVNRIITVRPDELMKFTLSTHDSNDSGVTVSGQLLSVVREHDSTTILRPCNMIDARDRYEASNSDSLKYRSKYNPGFYILNGKLHTVPASAGSNNDTIVTQVAYAVNQGHSSSSIDNFPDEYEYLVVLYASMRSLHASMGAKEMPAEPVFEELPSDLSDASIVFGSLTEKLASTINTGDMTVGTTGSVPTYTSPSTALTAFSIVSVPPDPPTIPGFSASISSTLPTLTVTPTYVEPSIAGVATDITGTMSTGGSKTDFGDWWDKWGDYIEDNDDPELAGAHGTKLSAFLNAYSLAMQNNLNVVNSRLQTELQSFNGNMQKYQNELQNIITEKQFTEQAKHAAELQQFQANISIYQAEVQTEVNEYQNKIARYQSELQDASNTYQANATLFQADLQKQLAEYQADIQLAVRNADHQGQQELEKKTRDMEALIQDFSLKLQNYQSQITRYQADSASSLQLYQADISKVGAEYQWLQDQYGRLRAEYEDSFTRLAQAAPEAAPEESR